MRKTNSFPNAVHTSAGVYTFRWIYDTFSQTKEGNILSRNIRFHAYKPQAMTNSDWEALLGDDVNNLKHLWVTYELTQRFLTLQPDLSVHDQEILLLTAITHDWAEAIVGDVMYYSRSAKEEEKERDQFHALLKTYAEQKIFPSALTELIKEQCLPILENRSLRLGKVFNAVERLGYLSTALNAFEKSRSQTKSIQGHLLCLAKSVLYNHISILVDYAAQYTKVKTFLYDNAKKISTILYDVPDSIISQYNPGPGETCIVHAQQTKDSWKPFTEKS